MSNIGSPTLPTHFQPSNHDQATKKNSLHPQLRFFYKNPNPRTIRESTKLDFHPPMTNFPGPPLFPARSERPLPVFAQLAHTSAVYPISQPQSEHQTPVYPRKLVLDARLSLKGKQKDQSAQKSREKIYEQSHISFFLTPPNSNFPIPSHNTNLLSPHSSSCSNFHPSQHHSSAFSPPKFSDSALPSSMDHHFKPLFRIKSQIAKKDDQNINNRLYTEPNSNIKHPKELYFTKHTDPTESIQSVKYPHLKGEEISNRMMILQLQNQSADSLLFDRNKCVTFLYLLEQFKDGLTRFLSHLPELVAPSRAKDIEEPCRTLLNKITQVNEYALYLLSQQEGKESTLDNLCPTHKTYKQLLENYQKLQQELAALKSSKERIFEPESDQQTAQFYEESNREEDISMAPQIKSFKLKEWRRSLGSKRGTIDYDSKENKRKSFTTEIAGPQEGVQVNLVSEIGVNPGIIMRMGQQTVAGLSKNEALLGGLVRCDSKVRVEYERVVELNSVLKSEIAQLREQNKALSEEYAKMEVSCKKRWEEWERLIGEVKIERERFDSLNQKSLDLMRQISELEDALKKEQIKSVTYKQEYETERNSRKGLQDKILALFSNQLPKITLFQPKHPSYPNALSFSRESNKQNHQIKPQKLQLEQNCEEVQNSLWHSAEVVCRGENLDQIEKKILSQEEEIRQLKEILREICLEQLMSPEVSGSSVEKNEAKNAEIAQYQKNLKISEEELRVSLKQRSEMLIQQHEERISLIRRDQKQLGIKSSQASKSLSHKRGFRSPTVQRDRVAFYEQEVLRLTEELEKRQEEIASLKALALESEKCKSLQDSLVSLSRQNRELLQRYLIKEKELERMKEYLQLYQQQLNKYMPDGGNVEQRIPAVREDRNVVEQMLTNRGCEMGKQRENNVEKDLRLNQLEYYTAKAVEFAVKVNDLLARNEELEKKDRKNQETLRLAKISQEKLVEYYKLELKLANKFIESIRAKCECQSANIKDKSLPRKISSSKSHQDRIYNLQTQILDLKRKLVTIEPENQCLSGHQSKDAELFAQETSLRANKLDLQWKK